MDDEEAIENAENGEKSNADEENDQVAGRKRKHEGNEDAKEGEGETSSSPTKKQKSVMNDDKKTQAQEQGNKQNNQEANKTEGHKNSHQTNGQSSSASKDD